MTYAITHSNGDVQHITPTTGESADAYARGIQALDAVKIAPDTYVYRAEETGEWYEVTGHDLITLGLGCDYSHWCTHHGVLAEHPLMYSDNFVDRVQTLRAEAATAGDLATVRMCDTVLAPGPWTAGTRQAAHRCAEVLADADAQRDA